MKQPNPKRILNQKHFIVKVPDDSRIRDADWREYIFDAVAYWKGGFDPSDPFYNLDLNKSNLKVVRRKPKNQKAEDEPTIFKGSL